MTSHERHAVSNHRPLGCLFTQATEKIPMDGRCDRNPSVIPFKDGPVMQKAIPCHDVNLRCKSFGVTWVAYYYQRCFVIDITFILLAHGGLCGGNPFSWWTMTILSHVQYEGCRLLDNAMHLGINSHCTDLVLPECSAFNTRGVGI